MVDTLELGMPKGMRLTPFVEGVWNDPFWQKKLRMKADQMYETNADLRAIDIPARISIGHRIHRHLGPKVQLYETGEKCYSEWISILEAIFKGDVEHASIMRADLTADVFHSSPGDFSHALWCNRKLIVREEYGAAPNVTMYRGPAQTYYYGKKPHQFRIYAKTLHRLTVLLPQENRKRKKDGFPPLTFKGRFGYEPTQAIARFERQMGDREPEDKWGIRFLGDVHKLIDKNPFENFRFSVNNGDSVAFDGLSPEMKSHILLLRRLNREEGINAVRAHLRAQYSTAHSFRYWWNKYANLIINDDSMMIRVEQVTALYRESLRQQLAA